MKYLITESKLFSIIERLIINNYGKDLEMFVSDSGYIRFSIKEPTDESRNPFERNLWGRLWVNDSKFYHFLKTFLGLEVNELNSILRDYFSQKYNIEIKDVVCENYEWYEIDDEDL